MLPAIKLDINIESTQEVGPNVFLGGEGSDERDKDAIDA